MTKKELEQLQLLLIKAHDNTALTAIQSELRKAYYGVTTQLETM